MEASINTLGDSLKAEVNQLVIIEPSADSLEVIGSAQIEAFRAKKSELVAAVAALPVDSQDGFADAGSLITACDSITALILGRFDEPIALANKKHKALTGARSELTSDLVEVVAKLKSKRATWKAADDAWKAREAAAEQARLRAEAEAKQRAEAEAARIEAARLAAVAAEEKRIADEAAAEQARIEREAAEVAAALAAEAAVAAAEIEDPDAAMEAAVAAEEAAEQARMAAEKAEADRVERERIAAEQEADRLREAEEARVRAEQAAAAPVVVARVAVEAPVVEAGVTWADNWEAEYDPETALRAIIAAGRIEFLMLNEKAINAAAKSQKNLANIPGVRVVNNKIERRSRK